MQEEAFVARHFKEFYSNADVSVPSISQREFGVGDFGKKISRRHLSFQSDSDLNFYLKQEAPLFISYSLAYYEHPERTPMAAKGFDGADIVYEFDADDLKTECKQRHDNWVCVKCGEKGNGALDNCPKCGSHAKVEQWFCPECLDATKDQMFTLIKFLENDLQLNKGLSINFSGNAGYHLHLRSDAVKDLSHSARLELLDYLTASSLELSSLGFYESSKAFLCPLEKDAKGWGKRILSMLSKLFEEGNAEKIAVLGGISNAKSKELVSNKDLVLKTMHEKGILFSIPGRGNKKFWESLISNLVASNALDIDRQTSADIRKIIRVPETLHGGTGLLASTIPLQKFKEFNPLKETAVFNGGGVKVFINKSPKFYVGGEWFGPFNEEETELPLNAAIYLIAKKRAELVG